MISCSPSEAALDDPAAGAGEARQLRLYQLLKAAILEGRLAPGSRLPGTRQLAADWGMARNCVLFAYQLLLAEGFVALMALIAATSLIPADYFAINVPPEVFEKLGMKVVDLIAPFTKGGKTDHVFFYDVAADGFSLDDKRTPVPANDLPDALSRWRARDPNRISDRTAKHFLVPVKELEEKNFDLSINRYKEASHEEIQHDPPKKIIAQLRRLEDEITKELSELEGML